MISRGLQYQTQQQPRYQMVQQCPQPHIGQRCHAEGIGFGIIYKLQLDPKFNEVVAFIHFDGLTKRWLHVKHLELLGQS